MVGDQQPLIQSRFGSNNDMFSFLASDQLVYLEKLLGLDDVSCCSYSSSSSDSSQVTMEDERSANLPNTATNLQETVLFNENYHSSAGQQHQFWYEDCLEDGGYSYNYEVQDHLSDHARPGSKTMLETLRNDDQQSSVSKFDQQLRYLQNSCVQIDSKGKYQPCSQKLSQQNTKLNSKAATAKRRNRDQEVRKNERDSMKRPKNEADPTSKPSENKVRKEKMGDRITTLQRLVSPFGKSDTASVLSECIEYIKFLHEQVSVLSKAYLTKDGTPMQYFQDFDESFSEECASDSDSGTQISLRSRGLSIMPISSTSALTNGTPLDFWTPAFGDSKNKNPTKNKYTD